MSQICFITGYSFTYAWYRNCKRCSFTHLADYRNRTTMQFHRFLGNDQAQPYASRGADVAGPAKRLKEKK